MDGVLVDSRTVFERTWRRWAARHGLDPQRLLSVAHGRRTRETLAEVAPHLATDAEVNWLDAAELEDLEGVVAVEGAPSFVGSLARSSWAVVTSAGRELALRRLSAAGLPAPPLLVSGEDVKRGKPAPDGYLAAAEALGHSPSACLVFEDAPPGIEAGLAAGARVVALSTTHRAEQLAAAHLVVENLAAVRARAIPAGWLVAAVLPNNDL